MKKNILPFKESKPNISDSSFVASGAIIVGDVEISENTNIWYNSVLRGDVAPIKIGKDTNVQDLTLIHTSRFNGGCTIGDRVTIGHSCVLHACNLKDDSFIGMGAMVMDKVVVESFGFVAAKALVTPGKVVKSYELWAGVPAKFVRKLTDEEISLIKSTHKHYVELAKLHKINN